MSNDVLTQTIVTGSDPRNLPEFIAIREEINKASHPSQPEMNWRLVESLALTILKPMVWTCIQPPTTPWRVLARRGWPVFVKEPSCWRQ